MYISATPHLPASPAKRPKTLSDAQMCADLEAELAAKHIELDTSKTTILGLLDTGRAESPPPLLPPVPPPAHSLRSSFTASLRSSGAGRPADIFVSPAATFGLLCPAYLYPGHYCCDSPH